MKVKVRYFILFFFLIGFSCSSSYSQEIQIPERFIETQGRLSKDGAIGLFTWSMFSITYSGLKSTHALGEQHYFHRMNAIGGMINLAIGLPTLVRNYNIYKGKVKLSLEKYDPTRPLFVYSGKAWLDVIVLGTGFIIKSKANRSANPDLNLGIGKGLILQAGFALTFDSVMYLLHRKLIKNLVRNQP